MVQVELVYAPIEKPLVHLKLSVSPGSTVSDVLAQSGLLERYPEVSELSVGIFSKQVPRDTVVQPGSRIEIYRELLISPMEKRRQRARKP